MYIHVQIQTFPTACQEGNEDIPHCEIPDILHIRRILTNIGHRSVHQSGLDESSGRNPTIIRDGVAFRVYFMFSQIGKGTTY